MKAWMRSSSVCSRDSAGSDPAWPACSATAVVIEVHDHGGQPGRAGGLVAVHVQRHPAEQRGGQRAGSRVGADRDRGEPGHEIARQGQHLAREAEHRELHARVVGQLVGPGEVVDGELPRPEPRGPPVLQQAGLTGHGQGDPVELGAVPADQARCPVHAVRRRGLHPAHVHRPELAGRDLAPQRDVRIAAEIQRTEGVAHDGPPGVATLLRRNVARADQDGHACRPSPGRTHLRQ